MLLCSSEWVGKRGREGGKKQLCRRVRGQVRVGEGGEEGAGERAGDEAGEGWVRGQMF